MAISDSEPPGKTQLKPSKIDEVISESQLPLLHYIPRTAENHFFYQNGLSKLIPRLTVQVFSDLSSCFSLWEEFSPNKSLFDLWDFRLAWYEGYGYKPYFYTIFERKRPLAVLPLWYSDYRNKYMWFGSDWMEDNTFFVRDEKLVDVLFEIAPNPLLLNAVEVDNSWNKKKLYPLLKADDPKNLKSLNGISSIHELLHTFSKKDRYNLRSDYFRIADLSPKVVITGGKSLKHLNRMIELNIQRFSKDPEDESDLVESDRRKTYEQMNNNEGDYKVRFVEVYIQNHLAAIDLILTYNGTYYTMKGGNDLDRFNGIGNFMVYKEFEDALKNGFHTVDCLQMDNGWKHRFFDQKDMSVLEK